MNKSNKDRPTLDVGADLFISNLAPEVNEDMIKTTFSQFGQLACEPIVFSCPSLHIVDCSRSRDEHQQGPRLRKLHIVRELGLRDREHERAGGGGDDV